MKQRYLFPMLAVIIFVLGFSWPNVGHAASYVVTGAGVSAINGTYTEAGTLNGKPYYTYNGYYLWYNEVGLYLLDDDTDLSDAFYYESEVNGTPLGTWALYNSSQTEYLPAPTVTEVASASPPTATTSAASSVTSSGATLNGTINANGASTTVTFEYGTTISYGSNVTAVQSPVTGTSNTSVSKTIGILSPGTLYHFRVVGVNSEGTTNGSDATFTTSSILATVSTSSPASITSTSASLGGNVTSNGGASVTERGVVYSSSDTDPQIGDPGVTKDDNGSGTGSFSETISGLTAGTTYYVRAYAINSVGISYGSVEQFSTPEIVVSTASLSDFGTINVSYVSAEQSYMVSATNMTADLTITPPTDFEISTQTGASFSATNPITLTPSSGTISSTTIYVRYRPTSSGATGSLNITHTGSSATQQNVSVQGTGEVTTSDQEVNPPAVNGDATMTVGGGTGISDIDFTGGNNTGSLVVQYYGDAASNVGGVTNNNTSQYRWTLTASEGFTFTGATIHFDLDLIQDPVGLNLDDATIGDYTQNTFRVWKRSIAGSGDFELVPDGDVSYNNSTHILSVVVASFSEFIFGSNDDPLPVELSSFTGRSTTNGVELNWQTQSETDNAGFILLRDGLELASYENTTALKGYGTSSQKRSYAYTDADVSLESTYEYQLISVDYSGTRNTYPQTVDIKVIEAVTKANLPEAYELYQNYPNPFNPSTTISFNMKQAGLASIKVFDLLGRAVFETQLQANKGKNTLPFNGQDLTSGIYFYRLTTEGFNKTLKMMLMK